MKFLEEEAPAKDALRRERVACDVAMIGEYMKFRTAENEATVFVERFADREKFFLDGCVILPRG